MIVLDEVRCPEDDVIATLRQNDNVRKIGQRNYEPPVAAALRSPYAHIGRRVLDHRSRPPNALATAKVRQTVALHCSFADQVPERCFFAIDQRVALTEARSRLEVRTTRNEVF